jgi:hypothetical protein
VCAAAQVGAAGTRRRGCWARAGARRRCAGSGRYRGRQAADGDAGLRLSCAQTVITICLAAGIWRAILLTA